jgi:hypothetical protein
VRLQCPEQRFTVEQASKLGQIHRLLAQGDDLMHSLVANA